MGESRREAQGARAPSKPMASRSGRIGSVLLALPVRFQNTLNMHEIAQNCVCIMSIISGWGYAPDPTGGALDGTPPKRLVSRGGGKLPAQTFPPQRLRRLASSSSATQVQCAPPKTIFWIRP